MVQDKISFCAIFHLGLTFPNKSVRTLGEGHVSSTRHHFSILYPVCRVVVYDRSRWKPRLFCRRLVVNFFFPFDDYARTDECECPSGQLTKGVQSVNQSVNRSVRQT